MHFPKLFVPAVASLTLLLVLLTFDVPAIQCASCQHLRRVTREDREGRHVHDHHEPHTPLSPSEPDPGDSSESSDSAEAARQVAAEEEQQLRLEFIKQQILQRLGLSRAPKVRRKPVEVEAYMHLVEVQQQRREDGSHPVAAPRAPVASSTSTPTPPWVTGSPPLSGEDVDNQREKMFLFPVLATSTSATFNLTLNPQTTSNHAVKKIALLLKQKIDFAGSDDQIRLTASSWTSDELDEKARLLGVLEAQVSESTENLLELPSVQWVEYDLSPLILGGEIDELSKLVVSSKWLKISSSYIRIEYDTTQNQRSKRSVDCDAGGNSSSCCRESFYVNFTHIGWDNWIIQPAGYYANFCKGQCDISQARYHHTTVVQKYPAIISLCCSPREMSALSLIYLAEDGYSIMQKNLPNMVVESCDCA